MGPLGHVGTAMCCPRVCHSWVNSMGRLTWALDIYTGTSKDHPVQAQPTLVGDKGYYGVYTHSAVGMTTQTWEGPVLRQARCPEPVTDFSSGVIH